MIKVYGYDTPFMPGFSEIKAEFLTFPGGEEHVKLNPEDFRNVHHVVVDARIGSSSDFMRLLVLNDAIARLCGAFTTLFIPYLPAARQDRGQPLSAKVYADLLNSCEFDEVITVDPHSDVMPSHIKRLTIIPIEHVFVRPTNAASDKVTLIVPDQGAGKRVEAVASAFGYQRVTYARKHRDFSTGKLSGFSIEPIYTPHAIMVDDICDGGGTFIGLADEIVKTNLRTHNSVPVIDLWVTHGIFSRGAHVLEGLFRSVFCTDSFPIEQGNEDYSTASVPQFSLTRVPLLPILEIYLNNEVKNR